MHTILVVADNYPSIANPTRGIFVFNLIQEFANYYHVDVIVPEPIGIGSPSQFLPGEKAQVRYTCFISFSKIGKKQGIVNTFVNNSKRRAIERAIPPASKYKFVYCHFLSSAIPVMSYCRKRKIPLFVAMGESSLEIRYQAFWHNAKYLFSLGKSLTGCVAVSQTLYNFCLDVLGVESNNILISPNAVDTNIFKPITVERNFLNANSNDILLSFVGAFVERKGFPELLAAVKDINNVKLVLIGKGAIPEGYPKIAFAGQLPHSEIPKYLNATDIFVFPTKAEGSSNALAEAISCGLPIITSKIPEVVFQLGEGNAVFVEPGAINELRESICQMVKSKELRMAYSLKSLSLAGKRSIQQRANEMLQWIGERI